MQFSRIFKINLKPHKNIHQNCRGAEGEDLGVGHINKVSLAFIHTFVFHILFCRNNLVFYGLKEESLGANNADWMVKEVRLDLVDSFFLPIICGNLNWSTLSIVFQSGISVAEEPATHLP